ncbi:ribonuclease H-like domain-containing protein [Umbelopsis sp. AD052]|nr:ribonuclease H-like domain-containing protein [Umbelopsis sp. AD052]
MSTTICTTPGWAHFTNRAKINHVALLYVHGLTESMLKPPPYINGIFEEKYNTHVAGNKKSVLRDPFFDLIQCPMTKSAKRRQMAALKAKTLRPKDLMLDHSQLVAYSYPIHSYHQADLVLPEGWMETSIDKSKMVEDPTRILSMDCEMCVSTKGRVLTRVAIVDRDGKLLLDELVKPNEPIIDYVTQYSGITEEMLKDVTTTHGEAQQMVMDLLDENTMLLGHSLDNDLSSLRIRHPFIIDTAVTFPHPSGPPLKASLKWLTNKWLSKDIQNASTGHHPVEDAQACLDLVEKKLRQGASFGIFQSDMDSILDHLSDASQPKTGAILCTKTTMNTKDQSHANQDDSFSITADDDELANQVCAKIQQKDLVVARFRFLEETLWQQPPKQEIEKAVLRFHDYVKKIYDEAPAGTVVVVANGGGNRRKYNRLTERLKIYETALKKGEEAQAESLWTDDLTTERETESLLARSGLMLVALKPIDCFQNIQAKLPQRQIWQHK